MSSQDTVVEVADEAIHGKGDETIDQKPVREDLVSTAVRFLENPRVAQSSDSVKTAFLSKKGLNQEEIRLAFQRAKPVPEAIVAQSPPPPPHPVVVHQTYTVWQRLRDLGNIIVLIVGSFYGIQYLWQRYVRDWLYGKVSNKSGIEQALEKQVLLMETMVNLDKSLERLRETLNNQQTYLQDLLAPRNSTRDSTEFKEIRQEIQSVKGLLLNSNRFPSNPPISAIPTIPAWQLETNEDKADIEADVMGKEAIETPDIITNGDAGLAPNKVTEPIVQDISA